MAGTVTQYIDGVRVVREMKSGATPDEIKFKVHRITTGTVTAVYPNYIDAIKSVGTDRQWTNVDVVDLDGATISTLTIEEADKVRGPFRSVTISSSQVSGADTSTAPSLIVWEKLI
tara:strand:+ start:108 stop:455 length:348 start_codon:yes stop_codon:yes gene_type:complete